MCFSDCGCIRCPASCGKSMEKEIWRLRFNWLFLFIMGSLYAISYTSISSSFHQFVTNPTADELNGTSMEAGLGQSEEFYSWVITLFNVGALIGAILCGFLVKFIPYWHLMMLSLLAHTAGYVMYAVTYEGWIIMISKLLSGFYIGAEMALALSYFAESSVEYDSLMKNLGKKSSRIAMRNSLFALHNIGVNVGYIFGPGLAVVFAQFDFDQFRSIAWYNVAGGIALMLLQIVMFHGESSCQKLKSRCQFCCVKVKDIKIGSMDIFILTSLIILCGVLSFRFGAYETIYNPVLSDYFGFNERDSSYFFFGLVLAQLAGTLFLIALQKLKLTSQVIAIIGLLMTVVSCLLMTDWQALFYDECTEFSPFHHPELIHNSSTIASNSNSSSWIPTKRRVCSSDNGLLSGSLTQLNINPVSQLTFSNGQNVDISLQDSIRLSCHTSSECALYCLESHRTVRPLCIKYSVNKVGCLELDKINHINTDENTIVKETVFCSTNSSALQLQFSICVQLSKVSDVQHQPVEEFLNTVYIQTIQHLDPDTYNTSMLNCINANVSSRDCYWNPYSIITRRHCEDCQPICRSRSHSLTFAQFLLGAALLLASIPVAWVPVAALISNRVSKEAQGIVMGIVVALTAIGRSFSPLWLDAAYEGLQKRTVLAMLLLMFTHLPFLVGIIVFYRQLNYTVTPDGYSEVDNEDNESENESDKPCKTVQ